MEPTGGKPLTLAILGTGAMGRYWTYRLRAVHPWIVGEVPPPYHLKDHGVQDVLAPRHFSWDETPPRAPDVVVLATKWRRMGCAIPWIRQHASGSFVVSLMNGMGQEEALAGIPSLVLAAGITTAAVTRFDQTTPAIEIRSPGETLLPETRDPREQVLREWAHTHQWEWQWRSAEEMRSLRWQKLLQNSVINPLTALADCPNGDLPRHPLWSLSAPLLAEGESVAHGLGIAIPDDMAMRVHALTEATAHNISSMLQDVREGNATEIDAINGYIARKGQTLGIPTPAHQALWQLISQLRA
ncbi:MAG: 2-dehydropantoate 2-reductase [Firmicutes bacterium]|nr:2-dehydropantoate 2-reductase [Bacillota bacterium]